MLSRFLALFLMVVSAAGLSSAQAPANTQPLDIYFIDTEGGQATLYVSPSGQTLLVDTGNAGERDLGRILGVLELAGVKQIDHLFLTHYHGDHYGSMPELAKRIPIKHFYDHGDSVELDRPNIAAFAKVYAELVAKTEQYVFRVGDRRMWQQQDKYTNSGTSDYQPLNATDFRSCALEVATDMA